MYNTTHLPLLVLGEDERLGDVGSVPGERQLQLGHTLVLVHCNGRKQYTQCPGVITWLKAFKTCAINVTMLPTKSDQCVI